ncbi:hypothetical protein SISSUDRAFT_1067183 [Sistotremastrum suecicum HHB10207 ss-3]|uniref:tyrosinase n=1 Tax=Sistotremastrum suecicum HHB10207 ss-3 TaxID=1314776 RepID=A0A165XET1_9AGAM|nr:hypothetical protein SISSUDRAFT_1067183 [Sistotremastrum suecicum HHB10207 ss-3]
MGDTPNNTYPITGIQEGLGPAAGQVPLRQEIDAWSQNPSNATQINLLILAMARFEDLKVEDKLSFWQVAGIHGQPLVPWDEDTQSQSPGAGYCTHGSILFPLWHRPYILLFEQRLYEIMRDEIIPSFPQSQQSNLFAAARTWRFPYWDWAQKKSRPGFKAPNYDVPLLVKSANVDVLTSTGKQTIPNPLYSFKTTTPMGDHGRYGLQPIGGAPYDISEATSKWPPAPGPRTQSQWVKGVQNYDETLLAKPYIDCSPRTSAATTPFRPPLTLIRAAPPITCLWKTSTITFTTGLAEKMVDIWQMSLLPPLIRSSDSITGTIMICCTLDNIDQQCAIWQSLNPDAWFDDPSQQLTESSGNWSAPPGTTDTPTTALAPFHTDTQGTYWIADDSRDWTKLGYSYPELQPWLPHNARSLLLKQSTPAAFSDRGPSDVHHGPPIVEENDYVVNVRYERFALGGQPFTVHIYIGQDTRVGTAHDFSIPVHTTGGADGCANCRAQKSHHALSTGQVPIIGALIKDVADESKYLNSLERDSVEEYLKTSLHRKVTKVHGEEVPLNNIPSLTVSLAAGTGRHYGDHSRRSKYHSYRILHSVTEGRPGGYVREGQIRR